MRSRQIRQQFLDYFVSKEHTIVESSPVVPLDDPTLMFTNAGMNQFKDVFLGTGSRPYKRVADTQKCIRAGGKHNDLDDVGQDTYHHTFFEMLGNWSFGDYFKKEAIEWAWELLTEVWGIDKDRLHATYFEGDESEGLEPDTEAAQLWRTVTDIDPTHVHPGGKKDNFWEMGDTGPCGPCSEVHIDITPDKSGGELVNAGDPRVIELWNLVFIQFNRDADGRLTPLSAKHVDTGMGFERLVAVLQGMESGRINEVSNYDTDVFTPIFEAIQKRTGAPDYRGTLPGGDSEPPASAGAVSPDDEIEPPALAGAVLPDDEIEPRISVRAESPDDDTPQHPESPRGLKPAARHDTPRKQVMTDVSYRVIADHVRCLTFALTDGEIPSNESRGYVLRRILRRAVRCGRQYMNMHEPFMCDLVEPVVEHMGDTFPELWTAHGGKNVEHVAHIIREEEIQAQRSLERGERLWGRAALDAILREINRLNRQLAPSKAISLDLLPSRGVAWGHHLTKGEVLRLHDPMGAWIEVYEGIQPRGRLSIPLFQGSFLSQRLPRAPVIDGEAAFKLHDTHGFDIEDTVRMAQDCGLEVNRAEYERLMEQARERSATFEAKAYIADNPVFLDELGIGLSTEFVGYGQTRVDKTAVTAILRGNVVLRKLVCGESGAVVLARTPFYPEQGGQVSDKGRLKAVDGEWEFEVTIAKKVGMCIMHYGTCRKGEVSSYLSVETGHEALELPKSGYLSRQYPNLWVSASVDDRARSRTTKNHTSTHMLNWALRQVLGDHIQQKGSLVDPEKTRFDFSHNKPLTDDELARVEQLVNELIQKDLPVYTQEVPLEKARKIKTVRAVFGEKYADPVRVVSVGADIQAMIRNPDDSEWMKYPVELCGGTHLKRSSEAERFVLVSEEAVAKGIRRVVGVTGEAAKQAEEAGQALLAEAEALAGKPPVAPDAADQNRDREEA
ncbi:MAG: alanine--tRNA ligase, partial [Phycisphaerae bacterium]